MNITDATGLLQGDAELVATTLTLDLDGCSIAVRSNSEALLGQLADYFAHTLGTAPTPDITVVAIEREAPQLPVDFIDWKREPGKTGRKDSYAELDATPDSGRLVRKVRTGMVFLQSETRRIAAGPCQRYDNQLINFINSQYMNWLQQRDWVICHAAGLVRDGRCLGIAGLSGGGKSTLMLQLMDHPDIAFLTNDRLFVRPDGAQVQARGIPKLPRINPGTIVHNARLHGLLPASRREQLLALPPAALWDLEEKHDVLIDRVYGPGRIQPRARLQAFLVLNWQRDSAQALSVERIDPAMRPDVLGAIMKSAGPFYQFPDGRFLGDSEPLDADSYLQALAGVPIVEAGGGIDFAGLAAYCHDSLLQSPDAPA